MGPEPRCKRNAMASEKSGKTQDDVLVSTAWLSRRLADPDLVVIDASVLKDEDARGNRIWRSGRSAFETAGHIPGARFADLIADFSDPDAPHAFTRPGTGRFAGAAGKLGLSNRARIVAYDNTTGIWAARLWWLLRAFGHDHAAVLDGGLTAWVAESRPLERGPGAANPTRFTARERPGCFVDGSDVLAVVEGRAAGLLACVLRPPVFAGVERRYARPGHIPGSLNLPYEDLLGPDNRLSAIDVLRERLAPLIESDQRRFILYCGGGATAAGTALVLSYLGAHDVAVYDGSLAEWSADPTLPMVFGRPDPAADARASP
jgi:thiosulfate/3-mercaptopyruvate sulfurtransferase